MRAEFLAALKTHQTAFEIDLTTEQMERLADYYDLVQEHNPILHLVGPCSPEEFAVRHILESLTLLEFLPAKTRFADVGAGAGLPSIPCLIVREDLGCLLIESKEKKATFLRSVVDALALAGRAQIANRQFEEVVEAEGVTHVTCRALDKFSDKLPRLLRWSKRRPLLLFGGNNLGDALSKNNVESARRLMPLSEQRYLFITSRQRGSL
ncbi:MAG: 16S rRNA (guanine(527)-N(7))-methyltransferase RsmG [Pyrinomonadaceae bacterium]